MLNETNRGRDKVSLCAGTNLKDTYLNIWANETKTVFLARIRAICAEVTAFFLTGLSNSAAQ